MKRFRLGSLFGIPIQVDVTFLLVLPLFVYLIGSRVTAITGILNDTVNAGIAVGAVTAGPTPWLLGLAAAVGLFGGVVLHELGHSLTAMRYGVDIDSITLWIFGGIASFRELPEDWKPELLIAIAGPVVSLALGLVCYAAFALTPAGLPAARFVLGYLAVLNVALAGFNMLPGFPMDGGRVLRALLARTRPYADATRTAAAVGKGTAVLLGLVGLLSFNIIMVGIAFFIYIGATSESRQVMLKEAFDGIEVRDLMTPAEQVVTVRPDTSVAALFDRMLAERHTGYPVVDRSGQVVGIVTLDDASNVAPVEREAYTVADVMSTDLHTLDPETDAIDGMNTLQEKDVGRLLVTDERGGLLGLVTRTDFMRAFEILSNSDARPAERRPAEDRPLEIR